MGHKVHPTGIRLGIAKDWNSKWYAGKKHYADYLIADLKVLLVPKDPNDERNVFLEIRAGTGGDEAAIFAGDLLRMYSRYAEGRSWQVELNGEPLADMDEDERARLRNQHVGLGLRFGKLLLKLP